MDNRSVLSAIRTLARQVFTTREAASVSGRSISTTTQCLNKLVRERIVLKVHRGVWAQDWDRGISPYIAAQYLFPGARVYVSFISALHLHGIIEQIPQVTTLATTAHNKTIRTSIGVFEAHQIAPSFFAGFSWYKDRGGFLIAEPEKALVDCLYLSTYKKRRFGSFPELRFPRSFSTRKALSWAARIPSRNARTHVREKLLLLFKAIERL